MHGFHTLYFNYMFTAALIFIESRKQVVHPSSELKGCIVYLLEKK